MNKKETLYAYTIITEGITQNSDSFIKSLRKTLNTGNKETIEARKMILSLKSEDSDVLASFSYGNSFVFGVMMTLTPGNLLGTLPEKLLKEKSINIQELKNDGIDITKYKGVYYFVLSDTYLITNSNKHKRLSTYLNWLIQELRGNTLYRFEPLIQEQKELPLTNVKKILFSSGLGLNIPTPYKFININFTEFLDKIREHEDEKIARLLNEDILRARLVLEVKKRPKKIH